MEGIGRILVVVLEGKLKSLVVVLRAISSISFHDFDQFSFQFFSIRKAKVVVVLVGI